LFVEYATTVDEGLSTVEKRLDALRAHLPELADVDHQEGEQLRTKVGPSASMAHEVHLDIGIPEIHSMGLVYPVHWTATGATRLFPEMKADLILSKVGSGNTRLTFRGNYQPPLGVVGRLADRAGLRHVAEATVEDWVDRLAEALRSDLSTT
jgi:hypothetical protein